MTKRDLATALGISEQFMYDIETGRRNANHGLLTRMADVLQCPIEVLQAPAVPAQPGGERKTA